MKKLSLFIGVILAATFPGWGQTTYSIENSVIITNGDCELTKTICILPVPLSNNYQHIEALKIENAEILHTDKQSAYARQSNTAALPGKGENAVFTERFNVTLYPMYIDFTQFRKIYPYKTSSALYKQYTCSDGNYIDTGNEKLLQQANRLWEESRGDIIGYARLCYHYVAENFDYLNANTGLHPLSKLLADGGGDCGNLSTLFVTLLRQKGIPARHIVTVRPDGSFHVWADFYLEKYGWIPVDVTAKHDNPQGNFFGFCAGDGIVMSTDICHIIEAEQGHPFPATLLQTYLWWYWCKAGKEISSAQEVKATLLGQPDAMSVTDIYPRSAVIRWKPFLNACGYKVRLYEKGELVKEMNLRESETSLTLRKLNESTEYHLELYPQRKVENIITYMWKQEVKFTTEKSQ